MPDAKPKMVGYLVTPEKAMKHLSAGLRHRAEKAGLRLVELDASRPIAEQGTFAAIVHKTSGDTQRDALLRAYQLGHPGVPIIDPLDRVRLLRDRKTMLSSLSNGITILTPHDNSDVTSVTVTAPAQVTLAPGMSVADAIDAMETAGLQLPLLAKPQLQSVPGSHDLALIRDLAGLQSLVFETEDSGLQLPVVLQQYIPHGGLLTKVFAIGAATVMAQRPSLDASQLAGSGVINLSRVSKFQPAADGARSGTDAAAAVAGDGSGAGSSTAREAGSSAGSGAAETGRIEFAAEHAAVEAAEAAKSAAAEAESRHEAAHAARDAAAAAEPPEWLIRGLTRELQHELGLQLFNYDLLCPVPGARPDSDSSKYHVIDINFFPGYEKLPNYEDKMCAFLRAVVDGEKSGGGYGPATFGACSQL